MIRFFAQTLSGHYRVPGSSSTLAVIRTFPIAPPSTVVGFLESMVGEESGAFRASESRFAFGWVQRPRGRGEILRTDHVWATGQVLSGNADPQKQKRHGAAMEGQRPTKRETLFHMEYQFAVDGPFEDLIHKGIAGDVSRYGVLSLGESEDAIGWLDEGSKDAEWLIPGSRFALPVVAPKGYGILNPTYRGFDFSPPQKEVPDEAWL